MSLECAIIGNESETLSDAQLAAKEMLILYPDGLMKFATVSCVITMLLGMPGNIITIVSLARYEKVRNATAMFIMSLSFSDLLFCFNIPLAASVFHNRAWIHGHTLWRITLFTRYTLFVNSLFTILAITINRYILIAHPKIYTRIYTKPNIIIMLVCSWIFSFVSIIPISFVKQESCSNLKEHRNRSMKKVILSTAFILPCLAIILCYARIFCIVQNATKKTLKTGKRVSDPKMPSSDRLSTSVSVHGADKTDFDYMAEGIKITKMSSENSSTTDRSSKMEIADKIIKQSERFHETNIKKSIKFLQMALPTRKDRRLGTMILAIMITFCLGHLPIMVTAAFLDKNLYPKIRITAHILLFLSFCTNPIIYVVMSSEYRKAYKNLFKHR